MRPCTMSSKAARPGWEGLGPGMGPRPWEACTLLEGPDTTQLPQIAAWRRVILSFSFS